MRLLCVFTLILAGCASQPQVVEVSPECTVPNFPVLPEITAAELEPLSDKVYFRLEDRERRIMDWATEIESMLEVLCEDQDSD